MEISIDERNRPRTIEIEDFVELLEFFAKDFGMTHQEALEQIMGAYIAMFPKYITDGPGYSGVVFMIVWPGDPSYFEVLTRHKDGLRREVRDGAFVDRERKE